MRLVLAIGFGLVIGWAALLVGLVVAHPESTTLRDAARLLPDLIGLVRRLAGDPSLPLTTRVTLGLLVAYLLFPIDVVPDFIPVLGYADDAIVVALAIRRVVRVAGVGAVERHWRGSDAGLAVVRRLSGI